MPRKTHTLSSQTRGVTTLLGLEIARSRRARRWTQAELAERIGVSRPTVASIERGAPNVAVGIVFEAASLVGIELFGATTHDLPDRLEHSRNRLELLPRSVRARTANDDDEF